MLAKIKNPVENGVLEIDPVKAVKMEKSGYGEVEHVAIFDEAQRCWSHNRIANYLKYLLFVLKRQKKKPLRFKNIICPYIIICVQ